MTTAQFFVYRRPIAWTLLVATLAWGVFAYLSMPQRQDPQIQVRLGLVTTAYPGASSVEVEQELTRKIEKRLIETPEVERVSSVSRDGLSIVFVELFDWVQSADATWVLLDNRLSAMTDLPSFGGTPVRPRLDQDYGETVAIMLTLSSPPLEAGDVAPRAEVIGGRIAQFRADRPEPARDRRRSAVLVHPSSVPPALVERLGRNLLRDLTEQGLAEDGHLVPVLGAGVVDLRLPDSRTESELAAAVAAWNRRALGAGLIHPDLWPLVLVADPAELPGALLTAVATAPGGMGRYTDAQLRDFADQIRDRLRQQPAVGKVELIGVQEEAITLDFSNHRLAALGLDPLTIARRLDERNVTTPGGAVTLPGQSLTVKPGGKLLDVADIADTVIDASQPGAPLKVSDVAEVVRGYQDPPRVLHSRIVKPGAASGHGAATTSAEPDASRHSPALRSLRSVTLAIRQIQDTKIGDFDRDVNQALGSLAGILPADLIVERISDEPHEVHRKIEQFQDCFVEAVIVVVVVALLFMEWRSALLVAASIPLATAMTLGMVHAIGIDLQQISIAALIIALGLLVDDPVVASDAINRELAHGTRRDIAAWLGPQKLARAILFATLTNIVAFLPLLLVTGQVGEFIYSLPVVVTASLIASRIVSMTFMPLLGYYVLKGQRGLEAGLQAGGSASRFVRIYNGFTVWCLGHRWLTLSCCLIVLAAGVSLVPRLGSAFFPKDLHDVFTVNVFLPEGTPIRETRDEAARVVRQIDELAGDAVGAYTTFVGQGGPRFWLSVVPEQPAPSYAQILVHTRDLHTTSALAERLRRDLPPRVSSGRVTVEQLESGPPIGVPIQLRVFGDDLDTLRRLAGRVKGELRALPGITNIHDDWEPEALRVSLRVRPEGAHLAGLSHQDVANVMASSLWGQTATQLRERDRLIPVLIRVRPDERTRLDDLASLTAFGSRDGARVPLDQVAELRPELVPPKIARRDNVRCLTVRADVQSGYLPSALVAQLDRRLAADAPTWPAGYRYQFGGEKEEQEKGFASMATAMIASVLAIYLALVLQFNSIAKPLVVFAAVPFGLVGGLMGLLIFDKPVGFMAALGLSSLIGVIVSHIIVLFEYIEEAHERGEPLRQAVIDAALVRLRPVLVTVLATVGGLIPLALKGGPLWGPMCYVQIVGLLVATVVTKVIVPVLYVIFVEDLKLIRWDPSTEPLGPPADAAALARH